MLIDKKLHDLVDYLLKIDKPTKITNIAKELEQNRRVIYYNLDKINLVLDENYIDKIVNINNLGINLNIDQKNCLKNFLSNYDENMYFLSVEERQLFIAILICVYPKKVIIDMLMEICYVSRNTIVSDLKDIKDSIEKSDFNVSISVNKKDGYFILGDDLERVQYLYSLITELHNYKNEKLKYRINSVLYSENIMFGTSFHISVLNAIENNLHILGKEISLLEKKKFTFAFPYIILSLRKMNSGIEESMQNLILQRVESKFISAVSSSINNMYDVDITLDEELILSIIVLCLKKDSDIHNNSTDYMDLKYNIENMVKIFENNAGVKLNNRENFIDRLITHFKSLLFRKKYKIVTTNTFADVIINNYKDVFIVTKLSVRYLESVYSIKFTKSDIAYISLHFGSELVNSRQKINKLKRVLIVTSEQYSIRKLLENQCKRYLTNCNIVDVVTKDEISNYEDIDFIITTNYLDIEIPNVMISPLITADDITKIINFIQNIKYKHNNEDLDEKLDKIILEYIKDEDKLEEFKLKIKRTMKTDYMFNNELPLVNLEDLLFEDKIFIVDNNISIDTLSYNMGLTLVKEKIISELKLHKIIYSNNFYIPIGKESLLITINSENIDVSPKLLIAYLKNNLVLDNKKYKFVFMISVSNDLSHISIISELEKLLNTKFIKECENIKNKKDIIDLIKSK